MLYFKELRIFAPVAQLDRVPDFESGNQNPQDNSNQALTENGKDDLACFLALLAEKDPDLALVVERWPDLPEHIKAAIKTLSQTDIKGD